MLGLFSVVKGHCDLDTWHYEHDGECYYFIDRYNTWYKAEQNVSVNIITADSYKEMTCKCEIPTEEIKFDCLIDMTLFVKQQSTLI